MACQLQEVPDTLINKDQSGFMKGLYMGKNLLDLVSIIEYCNKLEIEAIIVSFDFEKAFDKVEWNILNHLLEFYNIGPNLRAWIKLFQTNMESAVLNYGYTSTWFPITRSLRQGCTLSPYIFVFANDRGPGSQIT